MANEPDIGQLSRAVDQFQNSLLEVQKDAPNELARRQVGALAAELKQQKEKFVTEYEKERQRIDRQVAEIRQRAAALLDKIGQVREQAAAAVAAAAAAPAAVPAPPPKPEIDPALGHKVRADFLHWLGQDGQAREGRSARADLGEAWQDWEGNE
jgi:hypothetical protein